LKKTPPKKMNLTIPNINPASSAAARLVGCSPKAGKTGLTGGRRLLVDWPQHEMFKLQVEALS